MHPRRLTPASAARAAAPNQRRHLHHRDGHYYRVAEVAAYFAVSPRTIYRLIEEGVLPAIRIKRCVRVPAPALARYETHLHAEELGSASEAV